MSTTTMTQTRTGFTQVNLLPPSVAHVADPHVARGAIEAEAPGVAQTVCPDLAARACLVDEWVAGRNGVWLS